MIVVSFGNVFMRAVFPTDAVFVNTISPTFAMISGDSSYLAHEIKEQESNRKQPSTIFDGLSDIAPFFSSTISFLVYPLKPMRPFISHISLIFIHFTSACPPPIFGSIIYLMLSSGHGAVGDGIEGEQQIAIVLVLSFSLLQLRLQLRCQI